MPAIAGNLRSPGSPGFPARQGREDHERCYGVHVPSCCQPELRPPVVCNTYP